jgi:hypothetical protein
MDLVEEVFVQDMSMRRFMILIRGLPADSAWAYFLDNDEGRDMVNSNINM